MPHDWKETHWEVGGPWPSVTVIECISGGYIGVDGCEPPYYEPVCVIHQAGPDFTTPPPELAVAAAHLIAAAPDLLRACQMALQVLDSCNFDIAGKIREAISKCDVHD